MEEAIPYQRILDSHMHVLRDCRICPRNCGVDRLSGKMGYCGSGPGFHISSICIHKGEEPAVSGVNGICNIFFSRCNLSCTYCQNWQISCRKGMVKEEVLSLEQVISLVVPLLDKGCKAVGFVSPSHFIPHVKAIIDVLRIKEYKPVYVYNTNGYDLVSELEGLEDYVDVYLPDFKYADATLARRLSGSARYPEVAMKALKEMYRQKGSTLMLDESGHAETGMIIRHLILPGHVENSLKILQQLAYKLSTSVAISLMAQYWPTDKVKDHPELGRSLTAAEYQCVVDELEHLGFYKGWVQDLESSDHYLPDFREEHPFGK
jgi:putative pyruvate formate lyase activating enzyme